MADEDNGPPHGNDAAIGPVSTARKAHGRTPMTDDPLEGESLRETLLVAAYWFESEAHLHDRGGKMTFYPNEAAALASQARARRLRELAEREEFGALLEEAYRPLWERR